MPSRRTLAAIAVLLAAWVSVTFIEAIAQGWYFGRCDQFLGMCQVRHVFGFTMSRDPTTATEARQSPQESDRHREQEAKREQSEEAEHARNARIAEDETRADEAEQRHVEQQQRRQEHEERVQIQREQKEVEAEEAAAETG